MMLLNQHSAAITRELLPLIVGLGFSFLLKLPNDLLTAALRDKHLASANGNFFLVRTMGCTTGLSIAAAIFQTRLQALLRALSYDLDLQTVDWRQLIHIEPSGLREQVLGAVSSALGVSAPLSCSKSISMFIACVNARTDERFCPRFPGSRAKTDRPFGFAVALSCLSHP